MTFVLWRTTHTHTWATPAHTHTHLHIWSTLFYPFGPLTFCLCAFSIDFRLSLIGKACQKCWPAAPPAPTTITPSSVCQLIAWLKNLMNFLDCSPPSQSFFHVLLLCLSHVYFFFLALFMLPSSLFMLPLPLLSLFMLWHGLKILAVGSGSVIYSEPNRNSSMAPCQIPSHSLRKRPHPISFQCNNSAVSSSKHLPGTA